MLRILVVDDHPFVVSALERLFAETDDMQVVATANGGVQAITQAKEHRPDVILMDLSMPDLDGVEATRRIVDADTGAHVVMLSSFSGRADILRAIDAGAIGYLLKDADPDELLRGIRAAARGESPIAAKAASVLVSARTEHTEAGLELSTREREVLKLVVAGFGNKQIAQQLGIAEKTVKAHLTNVFQRLHVTNRAQAASWAQRHGLSPATNGA
jgi:DNA-binding NarL/FixJ family response regulator